MNEYRYEWFSGTGKGGQHRNKHQNCCRCIHIDTGIRANGTSSRSREANKQAAFIECERRVKQLTHLDIERYRASSERVRTYHEPDNRVIDHKSGATDTYKNVVLSANIGNMIHERRLVFIDEQSKE